MIGRRLAVLFQLPAQSRLLQTTRSQQQCDLSVRTLLSQPRRLYSTPGKPRKAVGEPSRPVKRAVKRDAAKATSSAESPAKQTTDARKKAAAKKTPAKKPKKELTEEQKAVKAAKAAKLKEAELKKAALQPPKNAKTSAWTMFVAEKASAMKSRVEGVRDVKQIRQIVGDYMKDVVQQWKNCTPAEVEHYNHLSHTERERRQAEYKRWVESHSPEEIEIANRARYTLRLRSQKKQGRHSKWPAIQDERQVKRPLSAYLQFSINRHKSGDFTNISTTERAKLIGKEWRELDQSEKDKYKALGETESKRYDEEYNNVHGHSPPSY